MKRFLCVLLSVIICVSMLLSVEISACAEDFDFLVPEWVALNDVVIRAEKVGFISLKAKLPELFEKLGAARVAGALAYDRFVNGLDYSAEYLGESGDIVFCTHGPTLFLVPDCVELPVVKDVMFTLIAADIPDGTRLELSYSVDDDDEPKKIINFVKNGTVSFMLDSETFKDAEDGDSFMVNISFKLDDEAHEHIGIIRFFDKDKLPTYILTKEEYAKTVGQNKKSDSAAGSSSGSTGSVGAYSGGSSGSGQSASSGISWSFPGSGTGSSAPQSSVKDTVGSLIGSLPGTDGKGSSGETFHGITFEDGARIGLEVSPNGFGGYDSDFVFESGSGGGSGDSGGSGGSDSVSSALSIVSDIISAVLGK